MYPGKVFFALTTLLAAAEAWDPPAYTGYRRVWHAAFIGSVNTLPHPDNWNIILGDRNDNNELQRYTKNNANLRFSGSETLQIIPREDSTAPKGWTSARIESKYNVVPENGKITRIESSLRVAGNPAKNKQGLWYAFWMMGDSFRKGIVWPGCGELDLFENINGQSVAYGVAHCDVYPGGICKEPNGLVTTTPFPDNQFHVWRLEVDRRSTNWRDQSLTWFMDGKQYQKVTGAQVNNAGVWTVLAHSPYYFIFNVAVGGNWPGSPNADTWGGTGAMMEVGYVSVYATT